MAQLTASGTNQQLRDVKVPFSIDFGSSIIKVVYIEEQKTEFRLHFASFTREKPKEAIKFIKEKVGWRLKPGQEVCVSGVGCHQHKELLEKKLKVRLTIVDEVECIGLGIFFFLQNIPVEDLFIPPSKHVLKLATKQAKQSSSFLQQSPAVQNGLMAIPETHKKLTNDELPKTIKMPRKLRYPLHIAHVGSALGLISLREDGTFFCDGIVQPIGGRTLLSLGSMLADTQSFEELVALAEKGSFRKLDCHIDQLMNPDADDIYSMLPKEMMVFSMGHGVGKSKDDFSREDRAASIVSLMTEHWADYLESHSRAAGQNQIILTGGVFNSSQFLRDEIATRFLRRSLITSGKAQAPLFMKLGIHIGSVGALLQNK